MDNKTLNQIIAEKRPLGKIDYRAYKWYVVEGRYTYMDPGRMLEILNAMCRCFFMNEKMIRQTRETIAMIEASKGENPLINN